MKKNAMNQSALKIILVDENMGRSAILRRALQDKGHEVICRLDENGERVGANGFPDIRYNHYHEALTEEEKIYLNLSK